MFLIYVQYIQLTCLKNISHSIHGPKSIFNGLNIGWHFVSSLFQLKLLKQHRQVHINILSEFIFTCDYGHVVIIP